MPLNLQHVFGAMGLQPSYVRLLRHQTGPIDGRTPFTLWRDDPENFLVYQSIQGQNHRAKLSAPVWASFVVTPAQKTLFVGAFAVERLGSCPAGLLDPLRRQPVIDRDRPVPDLYGQKLLESSAEWVGRIAIDWGAGTRSWIQRAERQIKPILEIAASFQEERFPGYTQFIEKLSAISALPRGWLDALRSARGIYLLTCPRTREQYVGSATGNDGFLGRWMNYVQDGHGGNIGLKSREFADYQVSILETAGSSATVDEIVILEQLWKAKLQSREMGLNRN